VNFYFESVTTPRIDWFATRWISRKPLAPEWDKHTFKDARLTEANIQPPSSEGITAENGQDDLLVLFLEISFDPLQRLNAWSLHGSRSYCQTVA
jgi:hypothetical protein